jgi:hypothetical protein
MQRVYEELERILETYPAEEVIARIEALDPEWKYDLLPWQIAEPGEAIPWQAVYILKPVTSDHAAAVAWAEKRLAELKASGDVA